MINSSEIENFLKLYSEIYSQNPDLVINSDTIYAGLMDYGLTREELNNRYIENEVKTVENNFSNAKNFKAWVDKRQPKFLQLSNYLGRDAKFIKLYMSFPRDYIAEASKKIFGFIDENKIVTGSKISFKLRSDSFVIRVKDINDAKKIMNFVSNDQGLCMKAKPTNPFSMKMGKMGVGYDNLLSYNTVVSNILADYYKDLRSKGLLKNASLDSFKLFVAKYYNDTFSNCSKLSNLMSSKDYKKSLDRFSNAGECINNYREVTQLFSRFLNNQLNLDKFMTFYQGCYDKKTNDLVKYYDTISKNPRNPLHKENINKTNEVQLLDEYIKFAIEKYGVDITINCLKKYVSGVTNSITRTNDFRKKFIQFLPPDRILGITNGDIDKYLKKDLNISYSSQRDKYNIFINSCVATYNKYGAHQLKCAIEKGLKNDFSSFTNSATRKQMREQLADTNLIEYCKIYLSGYGYKYDSDDFVIDDFCNCVKGLQNNYENTIRSK